jgi:hypothetical protein
MFWLVLQGVRNLAISKKVEELKSLITFVSVYTSQYPPSAGRLILLKSRLVRLSCKVSCPSCARRGNARISCLVPYSAEHHYRISQQALT